MTKYSRRIPRKLGRTFLSALGTFTLLFWGLNASAQEPRGWHGDNGYFSAKGIPVDWTNPKNVAWHRPLKNAGNGSPVATKDTVFVTSEPTELWAFSRKTGKKRWRRTIQVKDTLSQKERRALERELKKVPALKKELQSLEKKLYRNMRAMRSGNASERTMNAMERLQERQSALLSVLEKHRPYLAPVPFEFIGYSSATPLVKGDRIFVVMGTGVVAALRSNGTRIWTKRISEQPQGMQGYNRGNAASPLWVDGKLIVALDKLYALNPKDGSILWTGPPYRDFGTPAVMKLKGGHVLITPSGLVLNANNGATLKDSINVVWYNGPVVSGDTVYFVGSNAPAEGPILTKGHALALRLRWDGAGPLTVQRLWQIVIHTDRYYGTPVIHDGLLFAVSRRGWVYVIQAKDGAVAHKSQIKKHPYDEFMASPIVSDGALYLLEKNGYIYALKSRAPFNILSANKVDRMTTASPFVEGSDVFLHTREGLSRLRAP